MILKKSRIGENPISISLKSFTYGVFFSMFLKVVCLRRQTLRKFVYVLFPRVEIVPKIDRWFASPLFVFQTIK